MNDKILVTGATGFVGSALIQQLLAESRKVGALVRRNGVSVPTEVSVEVVPQNTDIPSSVFENVRTVIHCAARVHVMKDTSSDSLKDFREVNVDFTLELARRAAMAGVKRFIFLSSVKVNGEETPVGLPFSAEDVPAPLDPYGLSKMEAEQGLKQISATLGIEIVVIRPVLIYGPGVKANFRSMMKWLDKGVPLPFGAINNRRSLVSLDNLISLIITCIDHPAAANQVFMVSDGNDVSTSDLLRRLANALGKSAYLVPVPSWILSTAATLTGRKDLARRLSGSLQVDIEKTRALLNWTPVETLDAGLSKTAKDFQLGPR